MTPAQGTIGPQNAHSGSCNCRQSSSSSQQQVWLLPFTEVSSKRRQFACDSLGRVHITIGEAFGKRIHVIAINVHSNSNLMKHSVVVPYGTWSTSRIAHQEFTLASSHMLHTYLALFRYAICCNY